MKNQIKRLLKEKFQADFIEVRDESPRHTGHPEAQKSGGGHYSIVIVSDKFTGKTLIERHRMVYAAVKGIKNKIHALSIKAITSHEMNTKSR